MSTMENEVVEILLVDDEPRNLEVLEAIIAEPGYRLLRAPDADTALRLLVEHDVAAIVMDIKMPGTSGFELAKMIKGTRRYRQIPILFVTAYMVDDQDVLTGYGAGAVDYLTKPLNPQIVRYKVAVFADLFRKTRALAQLNERLEDRVRERTAELERSETALRTADKNKDEFIAILAHELRNPLAPLRFGLDILSRDREQAQPLVQRTLASMDRQLHHMVRLIDDLLDMSRVSRGIIELKRERVELAGVIRGAVELTRPMVEPRGHALSVQTLRGLHTSGDPTRLAQIVGNLIHNAAKFTPEGGRIEVRLEQEGNEAVVSVVDSGEGIASDQVERAFAMFARVEGSKAKTERGLGIGLALGRRLAELHGGSLVASSEGQGRGTTLTLRLPIVEAAAPMPQPAPAPAPVAAGLNIVVIDDSEDIAETLAAVLEGMGHQVSIAYSGAPGIELIARKAPQVVFCDIGLPDIDGVEVCRRVRRMGLTAQPRMIALTGWGRENDLRRTREAGFDEHLVKPVSTQKIQLALSAVTN
jgi:signal transduction histidine kinase